MKEELNKFTVLPSYWDSLKTLPRDQQDKIFGAIMRYGIAGIEPEFDDQLMQIVFELIRPNVDSSVRHFQKQKANGESGGRPKTQAKPSSNPVDNMGLESEKTQPKPTTNPATTQFKPNGNRDSESDSDSDSEKVSNKFETAHANGTQTALLAVENSKDLSISNNLPKSDKRNIHVEQLINWFVKTYGFPPTDKKPRNHAFNIARRMEKFCRDCGKDPTTERISTALESFCIWYASKNYDGTESMATVFHKFDVWRAEVEGKRKTS